MVILKTLAVTVAFNYKHSISIRNILLLLFVYYEF